jgi:hypothetical protein
MTDEIYRSFYLVPIGITIACILLYVGHGFYLGYRKRLRASKSSGGARGVEHLKIALPTRDDWGWSPAFATAVVLLAAFVFSTAQGDTSTADDPGGVAATPRPVSRDLFLTPKQSTDDLSQRAPSLYETGIWAMNQALREENRQLKKQLDVAKNAGEGAGENQQN